MSWKYEFTQSVVESCFRYKEIMNFVMRLLISYFLSLSGERENRAAQILCSRAQIFSNMKSRKLLWNSKLRWAILIQFGAKLPGGSFRFNRSCGPPWCLVSLATPTIIPSLPLNLSVCLCPSVVRVEWSFLLFEDVFRNFFSPLLLAKI